MNHINKDNIDIKEAKKLIPPLIKGYLRLGAYIGDGAVLDEQFSTTDIFIILKTEQVTRRYKMHYEAKNAELKFTLKQLINNFLIKFILNIVVFLEQF